MNSIRSFGPAGAEDEYFGTKLTYLIGVDRAQAGARITVDPKRGLEEVGWSICSARAGARPKQPQWMAPNSSAFDQEQKQFASPD